jgi:hypothetical protein
MQLVQKHPDAFARIDATHARARVAWLSSVLHDDADALRRLVVERPVVLVADQGQLESAVGTLRSVYGLDEKAVAGLVSSPRVVDVMLKPTFATDAQARVAVLGAVIDQDRWRREIAEDTSA